MLSINSFDRTGDLLALLEANNVAVYPKTGSALESLVNATRSGSNLGTPYTPEVVVQATNLKDSLTKRSEHNDALDDIVERAVKAVQGHYAFAKTVVAPVVRDLVSAVSQRLQSMNPGSILGMQILVYEPPKPLMNSAMASMLKKYDNKKFSDPSMNFTMPELTASEIADLMKTGSGSMDADIEEWLTTKGTGFLLDVWNELFNRKLAKNDKISFTRLLGDELAGIDTSIAVFLLAKALYNKPLPETNTSLANFNATMSEFEVQAAASLQRWLAVWEKNCQQGFLVNAALTKTNKIYVNKPVYDKWLAQGGDNDVLFGNHLRKPFAVLDNLITANAEQHKANWNRQCALIAQSEEANRFNTTKQLMGQEFIRLMEIYAAESPEAQGSKMTVISRFMEAVETVRRNEIDDLWALALRLVCYARFPNTKAEFILSTMEMAAKKNPTMTAREAATVALIDYVCIWVADQFAPKKA